MSTDHRYLHHAYVDMNYFKNGKESKNEISLFPENNVCLIYDGL